MKKMLLDVGGLILFYSVIFFGVILLSLRFKSLDDMSYREYCNNMAMIN